MDLANVNKIAAEFGMPFLISVLAIWGVVYYFRKIDPRLVKIEEHLVRQDNNQSAVEEIAKNSTAALNEVAKSNQNVAHSLQLLNATIHSYTKMTEIMMQNDDEVKSRLYLHDDRAERIFTMLHEIWLKNGFTEPDTTEGSTK